MWGANRDIERVHDLLGAMVPPDLIALVLLEAETPEEAETLITQFAGTAPDDPAKHETAMTRINAMFDTSSAGRVFGCDCLRRAGAPRAKDGGMADDAKRGTRHSDV